jgi:hypothetical protein
MYRTIRVFLLVLVCGLAGAVPVYAGGLSTRFVEEKLADIKPGKMYSVEKMTKRALVVTNTTKDQTVDIRIAPEKPVDYNLVPGYEPTPNLGWVKVVKKYFKNIGPNQSAKTDIIIRIPNKKKYYGKKYQVYIYSHTAGKGTFRVGLMSRLLIHTAQK